MPWRTSVRKPPTSRLQIINIASIKSGAGEDSASNTQTSRAHPLHFLELCQVPDAPYGTKYWHQTLHSIWVLESPSFDSITEGIRGSFVSSFHGNTDVT